MIFGDKVIIIVVKIYFRLLLFFKFIFVHLIFLMLYKSLLEFFYHIFILPLFIFLLINQFVWFVTAAFRTLKYVISVDSNSPHFICKFDVLFPVSICTLSGSPHMPPSPCTNYLFPNKQTLCLAEFTRLKEPV